MPHPTLDAALRHSNPRLPAGTTAADVSGPRPGVGWASAEGNAATAAQLAGGAAVFWEAMAELVRAAARRAAEAEQQAKR